ncbi:ATP synthase subunit b, mitochondrial [Coccinella septempunctata]|uniref:ATP synthase subunit b, mitochondrial n=1 Tax=Coccinella septempunctata TaxID=41139 RepID=UPI001D0773B4|nr:ATP synthase subunit b, mitochondrial [Coccinella septempunctata]
MFSRALLSGQHARSVVSLGTRATATSVSSNAASQTQGDNPPEWRRPVRLQEPGKVRMGFIPEEWFQFFYKKTGVTGPYTFAVTLSTYMFSKEIFVCEHEFYNGLSLAILCIAAVKLTGPKLAAYLDKEIDEYENLWNKSRQDYKDSIINCIEGEKKAQKSMEGQLLLIVAKRENVALQLEADYRRRLMTAYNDVKRRLDFQVEKLNIEKRITQKNLAEWVVAKVQASITPDQEKQNIDKCISDLAAMAKA